MPRTRSSASPSDRAAKAHDRYVQRVYGLAPGEYARRLAEQDGRCAICTRVARTRRLAVDHDHATGRVRSLLCYRCNEYLGHWEFNPVAAHNASVYLAEIAQAAGPEYEPQGIFGVSHDLARSAPDD